MPHVHTYLITHAHNQDCDVCSQVPCICKYFTLQRLDELESLIAPLTDALRGARRALTVDVPPSRIATLASTAFQRVSNEMNELLVLAYKV